MRNVGSLFLTRMISRKNDSLQKGFPLPATGSLSPSRNGKPAELKIYSRTTQKVMSALFQKEAEPILLQGEVPLFRVLGYVHSQRGPSTARSGKEPDPVLRGAPVLQNLLEFLDGILCQDNHNASPFQRLSMVFAKPFYISANRGLIANRKIRRPA